MKKIYLLMSLLCFSMIALSQGSITQMYTTGNIPTSFGAYDPACNGPLTTVAVTLPAGGPWIVSDVSTVYSMLAQGGAWMSEQSSQLHFQNTATSEASVSFGAGSSAGTMNYSRTGVNIANGTYPGGTVLTFEMRAWRSWGGSACDQTYNLVTNNSWSVTVNFALENPPTPLQDPALPTCATGTDLSIPGSPNLGTDWYWQTTAGGTSTANLVSGPYTVYTNATYYARAYDAVNDVWSIGASSVVVSNMPSAPAPAMPVADQNPVCVPGTNITVAAAPGGIEYYWQGTNEFGSSQAEPATVPYAVTSTGTYYVAAYDIASMCWSSGVGTLVTVNSEIPSSPTLVQATYAFCSTDNPMDISAINSPGTCPIEVSVFSAGWGDGTTWTVTDNGGATVLSGGTYGNGYNDTQTIPVANNGPYTLNITSTFGDNFPNYSVTVGGSVVFTGAAPANLTTNIGPITCPVQGTLQWYSAATGGSNLGSGLTLNALGTSVLPTGISGTYDFYVGNDLGGCESSRELVQVIVSEVGVDLTAINETCTGYSNGSFAISNVNCGTGPFLYSVDGGAFGAIPTDLTAGSYSVVVQDATLLESAPITVVIGTTSTVIPDAPLAVQSVYNYCLSSNPMDIEAETVPVGCPIQVTISSAGWGDATTWTVTDNGGATVLSGGTYGNGYNDTQSIPLAANGPYNLNITSTLGDNFPGYSVSVGGTVVFSGTAPASTTTVIGPFSCPQAGDPEWYSDAAGTNLLGDQPILNALGTSVIPVGAEGSYDFYLFGNLNGCYSTTGTLVTVNVNSVLVDLTPIDETCIGYANGSFAIANIECGTGPFLYSIDGGAFGSTPSNLTAGVYSVVVQDAGLNESSPISITIGSASTFIPEAPTATVDEYFICTGETTQMIEAVASGSGTQNTVLTTNTDCFGPVLTIPVTVPALPAGATITSAQILLTNVNAINGSFGSEARVALSGMFTLAATQISFAGGGMITPNPVINLTGFPTTGGTLNLLLSESFDDGGAGVIDANYGQVALSITYTLPAITVEWYDAATNGNLEGTGSPYEAVGSGTPIITNPATVGAYEFYAGALAGGCYSVDRTLVTVNVNDVNVELTAVDASCNNSPTGSFIISNVLCGTAPFTVNVDGAGFGPIPTDLMPGTYSVEVMDNVGGTSAPYTLVVGEADAPTGSYMEDITDNGGQVSWNANGNETEWNVEWGLPGFTPGTGTEIGSSQAMDTFAIITGLDGNTNYDVYISANCGAGTTTGAWDMVNWTTDCGIYTLPFEETFEDNSLTRVCWYNENEVGAGNWTYTTGAVGGTITTAFEGTKNARFVSQSGSNTPITKLASPRFDFSGQDSVALIFAYAQESWGTQNTTKVFTNGPASVWNEIASYTTNVNAWTIDTLFVADTTVQIAFEGTNNWGRANVIDHVRFMPCTLNSGIDGSEDVCRLDGTFDLNTIVTKGEDFGTWSFAQNPGVLNGSIVSVSALPSGTFEFYYIVKTPCATDTTTATLTIFPPSSAGIDGTITACRNEPIYLLSGLSGNVDLGGQWYNPSNNPTDVSLTTSNIPGSYNFDYIVSNGVCPNDTSNILVTVGACDYLDIQELVFGDMNVYPNPTDGLVFISSTNSSETFSYDLLDVKGQVLSAKTAAINGTTTTEISLEKLEPGVYMIRVYNTDAEKTFRIIKQ